eukprot:g2538.t1
MPFERYVEIGRVCLINYGKDDGKLCTIIDILDIGRVLVDGPAKLTGVSRQVIPLKRVALTDYKLPIARNARQKTLIKAWGEEDIEKKWSSSSWAKKRAMKLRRAKCNDFGRFRAMRAKAKKNAAINKAAAKQK